MPFLVRAVSATSADRLTDSSDTRDKTYDEARSSQKSAPYIWATLGGALVLGGAVSWPIRRRDAARAAAATAPATV
jgi:hypothetical protein